MALRNDTHSADVRRERSGSTLRLEVADSALLAPFEGTSSPAGDGYVLEGPTSSRNARALQDVFPALRPQFVGAHRTSVGTGDRIGLATAGQAAAFAQAGGDIFPVLAQQSIREMDRLHRSAESVMTDSVFGLVEAGWDRGFGADCDHIKTTEGIDRGLAAGFTMFTLDPGDYVQDVTAGASRAQAEALPWDALEDTLEGTLTRYADTRIELAGETIAPTEDEIVTAAVKYAGAVAETARLYRHLHDNAQHPVETEIAVDETAWLTTFFEHYYLATELKRLGLEWFSFAPRYVDGFEKGLEFSGDVDELRHNLEVHHAIGETFGGYKISLHSGSDKYSIYPLAVEATEGLVHLKTSGTSYLCALEVIAAQDPELFGTIWGISRDAYARASASYQVSAQADSTPIALDGVDLAELIAQADARQILHVGYGDSLIASLADGSPLVDRFDAVLRENHGAYADVLVPHISRHLTAFAGARV
ncbi:tagaturonate epimerase family protein [Brachybacterium sp. DNPG3]